MATIFVVTHTSLNVAVSHVEQRALLIDFIVGFQELGGPIEQLEIQ